MIGVLGDGGKEKTDVRVRLRRERSREVEKTYKVEAVGVYR